MYRKELSLVEYDEVFLQASWNWLNDKEIRYLTQTPEFSKEDQLAWFKLLSAKADYKIWGIKFNLEKIGAAGLKNIDNGKAEYWGYIGEKKYWGQGLGSLILDEIMLQANKLSLSEIYLKVLKNNVRAYRLYINKGFQVFDFDVNFYYMNRGL